ncbi:MAG TPA: type II secretion system F family protein [Acidimicrobiales bacterium]|nr:type II secretion system F family protein [Acidimicrobiales bacterium]
MNVAALYAAMAGGGAVGCSAWRHAHPARPPRRRMAAYLEPARVQLGGLPVVSRTPEVPGEAVRRVLGPLATQALGLAGRMVRLGPPDRLELMLRQAGMAPSMDAYRQEYLRWLVLTPLVLGGIGALSRNGLYVAVFFVAGVFAGARRMPERVKARSKRRCERLRGDLATVAVVLALKIENNKSLLVAVSEVVAQGSGPVVQDLGRAVHLMNAGYGETPAFELIAAETAEPAAARFYRFLAAAAVGGLDLAKALLDQANELRAQRREEVERSSARRQISLVVPNLLFMAPVLFVFLLAPLPEMLFGK